MATHKQKHSRQQLLLRFCGLGVVCLVAAFIVGVETAGDVDPFERSQAAIVTENGRPSLPGDIDADGKVDADDVIIILETVQGLRAPVREQLVRADPDGDGEWTVKDALKVLRTLSLR